MKRKIVAGNWKMNGSIEQVSKLIEGIVSQVDEIASQGPEIIVCPTFVHLLAAKQKINAHKCALGAQDVSHFNKDGAYTGQVSATMLADIGCKYVIIGHSERRQYCGETDQMLADKLTASVEAGITPIFCIGESEQARDSDTTEDVIKHQILAVLEQCGHDVFSKCIVAYEPIWAIGTGKTATPEQAQKVHAFIRSLLQNTQAQLAEIPLLYGGSVKGDNAADLFAMQDIDGGLIGGASLKADEFIRICQQAAKV